MKNLESKLGVAPIEVITSDEHSVTVVPESEQNKEEDVDTLYARTKNYKLLETSDEALEIAMRVLRGSEDAKSVMAVSTLMKSISDISKNLVTLNKDRAETKAAKGDKSGGSVPQVGTQNNIFVGSSRDLNKMIASGELKINGNS